MPYSEVGDLLLGDLVLGGGVDRQKFIDQAADDMDAKLGWLYQLPLRPAVPAGEVQTDPQGDAPPVAENDWEALPTHEGLLLKGINNKLASGRLILTLDIAGEGTTLHAYGYQLVREANAELSILSNGEAWLTAQRAHPDEEGEADTRTPGIINYDEESLLLGFENTVMRRMTLPWSSQPGRVS